MDSTLEQEAQKMSLRHPLSEGRGQRSEGSGPEETPTAQG